MNYKRMLMCAMIGASMQNAWGMDETNTSGGMTFLGNAMGFFFLNRALQIYTNKRIKDDRPEFKEINQKVTALKAADTRTDNFSFPEDKDFNLGIQAGVLAAEFEKALAAYDENRYAEQCEAVRVALEANNINNTKE